MPRRAAATPPTRRSTRSCRSACSCRATRTTTSRRRSTSRASWRCRCCRAAPAPAQCGQTTGAALVIDTSKHLRSVLGVDAEAMHRRRSSPASCSTTSTPQLKPHGLWFPVDVSTSAQATLGGMAGNNSCGSRSIAYGNMVHNVLGIERLAGRRQRCCRSARWPGCGAREREIADFVREPGRRAARRDRGALAEGAAPRRRLQPRHLPAAERAALHRRRQRQPGAPAGRRRRHAGVHAQPDAEACAGCRAPRCWASSTSRPFTRRWTRRSTSSSSARRAVELVDRTMIELALRQPGVPADHRRGADRRAGGDPAGRVQRRRRRASCCASCARWSS